jgi:hypothetical protein
VVTTVFKPIAPANTNMAKSTAVEMLDIEPPRVTLGAHSIHYHDKVKYGLCQNGTHFHGCLFR